MSSVNLADDQSGGSRLIHGPQECIGLVKLDEALAGNGQTLGQAN